MQNARTRTRRRPTTRTRSSKPKARKQLDKHQLISHPVTQEAQAEYVTQHNFTEFNLSSRLQQSIVHKGYTMPTEIQDQAIKPILEGRDMVGIAGTGTGKTAAFLIPIIQQLIEKPTFNHALVVAPTRELANQITEEFNSLVVKQGLFAATLIGGVSVGKSVQALKKRNHLIIATPGRLMDMTERGLVHLDEFKILVLDEFDRMLDMGFLPDVERILSKMKHREQSLLFSATMSKVQERLVDDITNNPVRVKAGTGTHNTGAIHQDVLEIPMGKSRKQVLNEFLKDIEENKILLFCETKRKVKNVCRDLLQAGIEADMMHGDMSQNARERSLDKFKRNRIRVLVATNVVARGIDVSDVSMVINYEIPVDYNEYVHRIGRTGRAGKTGRAITIVD